MTFRRDVKAWAEAEVRRRMEHERTSSIESLLYPPHRSARSHTARSGIPPRMGIGRTVDGSTLLLGTGIILEHGMMYVGDITQLVPPDIYSIAWLAGYLSGPGTSTPTSPPNQYLIGEMSKSQSDELHWPTDPSYWLANPYKSQIWTDQEVWDRRNDGGVIGNPNLVSGLLRLFMQCVNGSKRLYEDVFTIAGGVRPGQDGLFRFWDTSRLVYQYWYIRTNNHAGSSVTVYECTPSAEGQSILEWLNAHGRGEVSLPDETRRLYDSWVLAELSINQTGTEILDSASMAHMWTDGASPVAHGWAYSRQRIGSPLEAVAKASIVTQREYLDGGTYWVAEHLHIDFSLDNGVVSASLVSQEGPTQWSTLHGEGVAWYPNTQLTELWPWGGLITQAGNPSIPGNDVPFYCFWGDDQEVMCRFNTVYEKVDDIDTSDYGPINLCGGGSGSKSSRNNSTITIGGCYVAGVSSPSRTYQNLSEKSKTFSAVKTGECVAGWAANTSFSGIENWATHRDAYCNYPTGCYPTGWHKAAPLCDQYLEDAKGKFWIDMSELTEEETTQYQNLFSYETPLVITTNPESVYTHSHYRMPGYTDSKEWKYSDFSESNETSQQAIGGRWEFEGNNDTFQYRVSSRGGYYFWGIYIRTGISTPSYLCRHGAGLPSDWPATSETVNNYDTIEDTEFLVTGGGAKVLPSEGSWTSFYQSATMLPLGTSTVAELSYYEEAGQYSTSGTTERATDDLAVLSGLDTYRAVGSV